ncbi:MAG: trimethylamine methyltransferase family protein [Spirochaetales bacterium]|jgi:trimethylamine:corrinoid methyltransferase-like protein|nr:trimethylamine methyltransferase family protein [Spirochaetales bacterium]
MTLLSKQKLQWLAPAELQRIHAGTCTMLSRVGVKVAHERAARILIEAGAERYGDRILISREMVQRAVSETAGIIRFDAPNPSRGFTVDALKDDVKFGTGGQALYVVHRINNRWEKKTAVSDDLKQILILCDQLEQVDFVTRPVECDVPEAQMDQEKAKLFKAHCTKPANLANIVNTEKIDTVIDIIGSKSYLSFIVCLVASPLTMDPSAADKLIALVERDIPLAISSCPQGGSTAAFSEVGELVQLNAELLFGFVLANAIRPGAQVLYRGIPITSDLYSDGSPLWCQPASIRRMALAAQLCRFYNLPCCGTAGVSDEAVPTAQGISEKVLSWSYEAVSGAHYINSALGMLEQVMSVSPLQYVIDNTALGIVKDQLLSNPDRDIGKTAIAAALEALNFFGVHTDEETERELRARVEHIEHAVEPYTEENIAKQIDAVEKAVVRKSGSNVFMKGARKGLREGYLYTGKKIEASLDLSKAEKILAQYG